MRTDQYIQDLTVVFTQMWTIGLQSYVFHSVFVVWDFFVFRPATPVVQNRMNGSNVSRRGVHGRAGKRLM